ncbi:MAG: lycopene cyclase domain-containing protein [Bacteroidota bacterium]
MDCYTYLLINLLTLSIPLFRSFEPRIAFYTKWKAWLPAILVTSTFFVVWDSWFTHWQVWGFNERYLLGIYLWELPLEEICFFVAIPYACLFLYETVQLFRGSDFLAPYQYVLTVLLVAGLGLLGLTHLHRSYTATTCLLTAALLALHGFYWQSRYLGRFYLAYLVMLIPFFVVNGVLTGTWLEEAVVWYNDEANLGVRCGTIPVEDIAYGMLLILMNLTIYQANLPHSPTEQPPQAPATAN